MCTIIITGSASLKTLSLNVNPKIGDNGMSLIVDHLHGSTTLTKLWVRQCGLSVKGALSCVMVFN